MSSYRRRARAAIGRLPAAPVFSSLRGSISRPLADGRKHSLFQARLSPRAGSTGNNARLCLDRAAGVPAGRVAACCIAGKLSRSPRGEDAGGMPARPRDTVPAVWWGLAAEVSERCKAAKGVACASVSYCAQALQRFPQGELLEPFHRILVVRNGPLRVAGDRLVDPLHPFHRSRRNQRIRGVVRCPVPRLARSESLRSTRQVNVSVLPLGLCDDPVRGRFR